MTDKPKTAASPFTPCPWCGSTPQQESFGSYHLGEERRVVSCEDTECRVHPSILQDQSEYGEWDLAEAWNTRAA